MEVTGKDILNLTVAAKMISTESSGGYYLFSRDTKQSVKYALDEAIQKYRNQLKKDQVMHKYE